MKNFVAAGVVALLMAGFYAMGSTPARHSVNYNGTSVCKSSLTDTVPKRNRDTTNRRDTTMPRKDSLQLQ